jgi:hypothetical protein
LLRLGLPALPLQAPACRGNKNCGLSDAVDGLVLGPFKPEVAWVKITPATPF